LGIRNKMALQSLLSLPPKSPKNLSS
jgi:hypothetical protein